MKIKIINNSNPCAFLMRDLDYVSDNGYGIAPMTEASLNRIVNKHDKGGYCIISACRGRWFKDGAEVPRDVTSEDANHNGFTEVTNLEEYKKAAAKNKPTFVKYANILSGAKLQAINNKRTVALKNKIIGADYSFIPVYGGFKEEGSPVASYESSFIVLPFTRKGVEKSVDELVADCLDWGEEFNQDSILVKRIGEAPKYYNCVGAKKGVSDTDIVFSGEYTLNDITQMFFTALKQYRQKKIDDNGNPILDDNGNYVYVNDTELKGKPQRFTFEGIYGNTAPIGVQAKTMRRVKGELF